MVLEGAAVTIVQSQKARAAAMMCHLNTMRRHSAFFLWSYCDQVGCFQLSIPIGMVRMRACGVRGVRRCESRTSRIGDSQQQLMGSGGELEPPATAASARPATHHAPSAAHVGSDAARASRCARDACAASMRARRTRSEPAGRADPDERVVSAGLRRAVTARACLPVGCRK